MSFAAAWAFTLLREGGYVNDPADPGGATKYGITLATLQAWRHAPTLTAEDVKALTVREATAIYEANYWQAAGCPGLPSVLGALHFDAAVNHGVGGAARLLKGIGDPSAPDAPARYLVARAALFRAIVAKRPKSAKFLPGWLARCRACAREAGIPIDPSYT